MSDGWRSRIVEYGEENPEQLLANPANWRIHPKHQQDALAGVLDEVGWVDDIIVNRTTGNVIDGHLRVTLSLRRGESSVPVKYVELSEAEEALVLSTFDPISALAVADREALGTLLQDVQSDEAAVQAMLSELAEREGVVFGGNGQPLEDPGPQVDRAEELQEKWGVSIGDVWQAGDHFVICGDCTDGVVVERVTQQGMIDLLFIDPPYGVKRDKGFEGFGGFGPPIARRQYEDDWDAERPTRETMEMFRATSKNALIFGGNFLADILPKSTHWVVWDKLNTMPTFGDCELIWTSFKRLSVKKITFEYNGLLGKEAERFHPTQKPLGLYELLLKEYSKEGEIVLDCYGGSGTTLVACERLGRFGRGVEIEPKYVAVTLERLTDLGLDPQRID